MSWIDEKLAQVAVGEIWGEQWTHAGLRCAMLAGPMCVNGYVKTPFVDTDPEDLEWKFDPSGGVTYTDEAGWIGFDTLHAFDRWDRDTLWSVGIREERCLTFHDHMPAMDMDIHWTIDKLREEVNELAAQVAARIQDERAA